MAARRLASYRFHHLDQACDPIHITRCIIITLHEIESVLGIVSGPDTQLQVGIRAPTAVSHVQPVGLQGAK